MSRIKETFAVLGLSRFGFQVAVGLFQNGASVIAVDRDDHVVQRAALHTTKAAQADAMDLDVLEHLGVFEVDTVVVGFRQSFEASVLLAHHLRTRTKVKRIIAQADTEEKARALRSLGVDEVVLPERDIADRLVQKLVSPDLLDRIPLSSDTAVVEVSVPASFVGQSLSGLKIRNRFGVYVVGIKRTDPRTGRDDVNIAPPPDAVLQAGETLLVLGRAKDLAHFAAAK